MPQKVPTDNSGPESALSDRLDAVRRAIGETATEAGRILERITTIVVTKFQPASLVRQLSMLGVRDFGESRHQEARTKVADVDLAGLTWHFVGQVQGKKARHIAEYSHVIHSVDRESLLRTLASPDREVSCFLQVNLTEDPARGGVQPEDLTRLAEFAANSPGIRVLGVMAVAPNNDEPRRAFSRLRQASESLRTILPGATAISAGMSGDFREAILEGATHLRIGTAITGNRPPAG